ncbi:MAG: transposase [Dehalococcoidales bacterium]|nr:transposase [Dehalococcoidales bacterium]
MDIVPLSELEQYTPCLFDTQSTQLPERVNAAANSKGLWIDPVQFLTLINGLALAHWACTVALLWSQRLHPVLPPARHPGGAPQVYTDETVLLAMLVLRAWRLSLEKIAEWLPRYRALAVALGMSADGPTISAAQLSRRSRQLGLWPYFFFFIALVWQLLRVGAISGRQLILDGSLLKAWYRRDPDAALAGRRRGPPTYGYKIHAVVDRWSYLPLLFVITPASVHEMAMAALLLLAAVLLYGLRVSVVYADSAYFSTPFIWLIRRLGAIPIIDYNLRRQGKRFLATLFFLDQWRRMRGPRTVIERCFAFLKRYYGLKHFQVEGLPAVWRHALMVHAAMLAVALIAYRAGRPDLMTRRAQVLAFVTN